MNGAPRSIVIAGGSIAALTAAETLRLAGHDGPITLLSEENHQPYSRVPLSKTVLAGNDPTERAMLPAVPRWSSGTTIAALWRLPPSITRSPSSG